VRLIAGLVEWTSSNSVAERVRRMLECFGSSSSAGTRIETIGYCAVGVAEPWAAATQSIGSGLSLSSSGLLVAVDGRLDNLANIQDELSLSAVTDVELVSAGYRRWGADLFKRLQGEYAIIIWDSAARTLIAARDPFSIRPLYYSVSSARILFANDAEQILASGLVATAPDDRAVVDYLVWEFQNVDRSFFRDIRRLPGGHVLVAKAEGCRVSEFRRPIVGESRLVDQQEYWAEFRRLFGQAVKRRLRSTSPVGAHLSGGVDSSSIVCVADDLLLDDPAICPGFFAAAALHPGLDCDEESFIRAVQARLHIDVEFWDGTLADPLELSVSPLGLPGARFTMTGGTQGDVEIARRRGARVLLSGTGGDQIGIPTGVLNDAVAEMRFRDAWRMVSHAPGATISSVLRTSAGVAKRAAPRWLREAHDGLRQRNQTTPTWLTDWAREYAADAARPVADADGEPGTHLQRRRWRDLISARTVLSIEYIQNHALRNGLEMRFPFFDGDLTAFVLSIPSQFWPPPWPQERLHREALRNVLPTEVVRRRTKANFSSALTNRVRRQLGLIRQLFASKKWAAEQYVRQTTARATLAEFEGSQNPSFTLTYAVWGIASLEAWLQTLFGYATVLPSEATCQSR
jgi:asparagine synthase (glutamine-hydrolysing)